MCIFLVFTFTSCVSTPPKKDTSDVMIFFYINSNTEYTEYESISLNIKSKGAIYSVDRGNKLMVMEIGLYTITDGIITINARNFQAVGIITDEKIVIDGKEFIRSKK
jgi:hypothetical protein